MLHYYAQNFLAPVLPSAYVANDESYDVIVEVVSDAVTTFSGSLNVQLFKLNDMSAGLSDTIDVVVVS